VKEMGKFKKIQTDIEGLYIVEPTVFGDDRGFFMETWNKKDFLEIGLDLEFVQDNHSKSKKGVLRGLHFQRKNSQGKLVRCIKGKVYDVAVDLRSNSKTFGKYYGIELTEENKLMFYIPEGFAHGYLALTEEVEFLYKATNYYSPEYESGIIWNDEDINVEWPLKKYGIKEEDLILSEKDKKLQTFRQYVGETK
jgi:dTDP-4-dehydrorhamnose 3,5-epimerase